MFGVMRYFFKSDTFPLIHPTLSPRGVGEYGEKELKVAEENTAKVKYGKELFDTAVYECEGRIPCGQKGALLVFPEADTDRTSILLPFIEKMFSETEAELRKEYEEQDDPTMFWEIGTGGRHFGARHVNGRTGEVFGPSSPTIYMAGCKDSTADYLVECAIDAMCGEAPKWERRSGGKPWFTAYRTFLVYGFGGKRFYEFGSHENLLYRKRRRVEIPRGYREVGVYDLPGVRCA